VGGDTRYARPWRPVKPFDIMDVVGQMSVRQRMQRRIDALEGRWVGVGGLDGGLPGEEERVGAVEAALERRRNGMLGRR
jgi:hypothetical protein